MVQYFKSLLVDRFQQSSRRLLSALVAKSTNTTAGSHWVELSVLYITLPQMLWKENNFDNEMPFGCVEGGNCERNVCT